MIVKNEEEVLNRCLKPLKDIVDEIIIIDTGSIDNTKEIAKKYTNNVYNYKWIDDFSKARNYSFSKASKDYILWLDADDVITLENIEKLKNLKNNLEDIDIVMMKYNVGFDALGKPNYTYYRERLVKRSNNYKWVGEVHEAISISGNIIYSDIEINHKKMRENKIDRNLNIFKKKLKDNKVLEPREQFYYGRELYYNNQIDAAINILKQYLEDDLGWVENKISACLDLAKCYYSNNQKDMAIRTLFRSFIYDLPRAEVCCEIGHLFYNEGEYKKAIYWYLSATKIKKEISNGGFLLVDCYDYIPYIQLCVCYYALNDIKSAIKYNEKAGKIKPKDNIYIANKKYFEQKITKKEGI